MILAGMLPRRILQGYRSGYLLTPAMEENRRRWKVLHPEWEYRFFHQLDAASWVDQQCPAWSELFRFYPVDRQREALFRWLVLSKLGGFWCHSELRPLCAFDPLLAHRAVVAVEREMTPAEFEALYRIPVPDQAPPEAMLRLSESGFAAEAGHPLVTRMLDLHIERAGFLDSAEPSREDEEFTTGAGVLNAAWLEFVLSGRAGELHLLPAPAQGSTSRPPPRKVPETGDPPLTTGFGEFAYRHTDLNS